MYIYAISNPAFDGWLKVGKTKDISRRMGTYTTCSPFDYKIEMIEEFFDDKPIHNKLLAKKVENSREWFKIGVDELQEMVTELIDRWE